MDGLLEDELDLEKDPCTYCRSKYRKHGKLTTEEKVANDLDAEREGFINMTVWQIYSRVSYLDFLSYDKKPGNMHVSLEKFAKVAYLAGDKLWREKQRLIALKKQRNGELRGENNDAQV